MRSALGHPVSKMAGLLVSVLPVSALAVTPAGKFLDDIPQAAVSVQAKASLHFSHWVAFTARTVYLTTALTVRLIATSLTRQTF
jgi:hypothetical protein